MGLVGPARAPAAAGASRRDPGPRAARRPRPSSARRRRSGRPPGPPPPARRPRSAGCRVRRPRSTPPSRRPGRSRPGVRRRRSSGTAETIRETRYVRIWPSADATRYQTPPLSTTPSGPRSRATGMRSRRYSIRSACPSQTASATAAEVRHAARRPGTSRRHRGGSARPAARRASGAPRAGPRAP